MPISLQKEKILDTDGHMKMEKEIGVLHLQAKDSDTARN